MKEVRLWNPTNRNTEARIVEIAHHRFYFSYQTCIAYQGPEGRARIENRWSTTTGKHFNEMGLKEWPIVPDADLEAMIDRALT